MINPDFTERTYTAEVLRLARDNQEVLKTILKSIREPQTAFQSEERNGVVRLFHGFLASEHQYHRFSRTITRADGTRVEVPRRAQLRNKTVFLYDVLIAQSREHLVIAVPFHQLAEDFFVRIDKSLSGSGAMYERLNITSLVMRLGATGRTEVKLPATNQIASVSVTRCHLAYANREPGQGNLKQIQMTGPNIGAAREYRTLVRRVLKPVAASATVVTPVILGFALFEDGVKKSSATTDRHGNFKLWVAPGLRRVLRVFSLLEAIEVMDDVASTTPNIPILQSKAIRDAEEK